MNASKPHSPALLVVGSANMDMVIRGDCIPAPGETVIGGQFQQAFGGKGANQAVAAARMGGAVTLLASLGTDTLGDEQTNAFQQENICVEWIHRTNEYPSGVALILVDRNGENCISVAPGANNELTAERVLSHKAEFNRFSCVLLQLEIPLESVALSIQIARTNHQTIILDPAPVPQNGLSDDCLSGVDFILPNEHEISQLTGITDSYEKAGKHLIERGVRNVLITLGSEGVLWVSADGTTQYPAPLVTAVDTTAAGDAFAGAFAVAFAQGNEIDAAIQFGQQAAALSVTRPGAQPSLPRRDEITV